MKLSSFAIAASLLIFTGNFSSVNSMHRTPPQSVSIQLAEFDSPYSLVTSIEQTGSFSAINNYAEGHLAPFEVKARISMGDRIQDVRVRMGGTARLSRVAPSNRPEDLEYAGVYGVMIEPVKVIRGGTIFGEKYRTHANLRSLFYRTNHGAGNLKVEFESPDGLKTFALVMRDLSNVNFNPPPLK